MRFYTLKDPNNIEPGFVGFDDIYAFAWCLWSDSGMTQQDLAEAVGVSASVVGRALNGDEAQKRTAVRIVEHFTGKRVIPVYFVGTQEELTHTIKNNHTISGADAPEATS